MGEGLCDSMATPVVAINDSNVSNDTDNFLCVAFDSPNVLLSYVHEHTSISTELLLTL